MPLRARHRRAGAGNGMRGGEGDQRLASTALLALSGSVGVSSMVILTDSWAAPSPGRRIAEEHEDAAGSQEPTAQTNGAGTLTGLRGCSTSCLAVLRP